jgi:hypothetical protein
VPARGAARVRLGAENTRAPVGSVYPVYAWFEYRIGARRAVALGRTTIDVQPAPPPWFPQPVRYVGAAALATVAVWLAVRLRKRPTTQA